MLIIHLGSSSTISLNSFELDHEVHPAKEKIVSRYFKINN
jgi:hypothetical protein